MLAPGLAAQWLIMNFRTDPSRYLLLTSRTGTLKTRIPGSEDDSTVGLTFPV